MEIKSNSGYMSGCLVSVYFVSLFLVMCKRVLASDLPQGLSTLARLY